MPTWSSISSPASLGCRIATRNAGSSATVGGGTTMSLSLRLALAIVATALVGLSAHARGQNAPAANAQTTEIAFTSHDGYPMRGKLTVPNSARPYPVVVYV